MEINRLIEENIPLIYFTISKYYPDYIGDDDIFQVGMIGLWKAIKVYDKKLGKFSTCAIKYISTEINNELLRVKKKKRKATSNTINCISLDSMIEETTLTYLDVLPSREDYTEVELEDILSTLTPIQREVVDLKLLGYNGSEIADMLGYSHSYISLILKKIRDIMKDYIA